MPFVETRFISPTALTTSASSALYTVPTGYSAIIKQLVVTNTTGTAATFTFYIGAASAGNALFSGTSVAANDTVIINLSQVLTTGEVLRALASATPALNLTVSGVLNDGPLASTATYIADNAITSAKIADGAIVNADINASAAIDKTKISGTAVTVADTGTVTSAMILDGTIATADIANNAVTQAKLSTDIPLSGFRNSLINGGMSVWQRWVAISIDVANGATGYTADRWYLKPTGADMSAIRDTSVPTGGVSQYSLAITPNGVGGSTCLLGQRIESANVYAIKGTVTFSAWVFNSTGASITPSLLIGTPSAADNFTTVTNRLTQTLQACAASAWTKVSYSVDISGYTNINNGLQVELQTNGHTTYGKIVKVAQLQLELGSQATPFEQRPIGIELALCQRYYWRSASPLTTDSNSRHAHFRRLNAYQMIATGHCAFPVPMRAEPSVSLYNGNGIGYVDAYGAGQESYVIASGEGLSTFGFGMIVKYTNSGLGTTANFAGDPASYSYWANIEASAEL